MRTTCFCGSGESMMSLPVWSHVPSGVSGPRGGVLGPTTGCGGLLSLKGYGTLPPRTEWLTDASENITLPQFRYWT